MGHGLKYSPRFLFCSKILELCVFAGPMGLGGAAGKTGCRKEIEAGSEEHSQEPVHSYDQCDVFSG